jgi:signal transduction histidine kinase
MGKCYKQLSLVERALLQTQLGLRWSPAGIAVTDQGPGIPTEEQMRVFDRFYRTDQGRSRENGGTGLGLSIVKWAVEVHSGSIGVGAGSKGGSCFYMRLPLSREPLRSD